MKYQVKAGVLAQCGGDGFLPILEDRGFELYISGLVDAVHIAESCGQQEAPHGANLPGCEHHVFGCGEELLGSNT